MADQLTAREPGVAQARSIAASRTSSTRGLADAREQGLDLIVIEEPHWLDDDRRAKPARAGLVAITFCSTAHWK